MVVVVFIWYTCCMASVDQELQTIKERNARVEKDKAWETSNTRIFSICILTYATMAMTLSIIGVDNPYLGALIPTLGFYLSTQSLAFIRRWWEKK